jgi:hypothetical protein
MRYRFVRVAVAASLAGLLLIPPIPAFAWGNKGHRMINRLAWQHLPADLPAFLRTAAIGDEIEYLGPEPDRWHSPAELELSDAQGPEHYIDLEYADRLGELPRERWKFVGELYAYGARHPDEALEMVPEKVGLQPWQAAEVEQRLEAAFREWREERAARRDTRATESAIVFYMGWLGHYVADGSQPLHTTFQFNGWNGPNPRGYTTDRKFHALFESDFVNANINSGEVAALVETPRAVNDVFVAYVAYLRQSNALVERTYELEKTGGFLGRGTPESRKFTAQRLAAGATMLVSLWETAWVNSAKPLPDWPARVPAPPSK